MSISNEDKRVLLKIARSAIQSTLEGESLPRLDIKSDILKSPSGVFVTLRTGENLRGCIGYVEPLFPLAQAVQDVAVKAALEDPRFLPVMLSEIDDISIEISVLSPLAELFDFNQIEIGKHGLVIESGSRRGLLLPQVATENGWNRQQFLRHTALKAGLPPDSWKQREVRLYSFTVEKFEESDYKK
jgi:uncharacterized protein